MSDGNTFILNIFHHITRIWKLRKRSSKLGEAATSDLMFRHFQVERINSIFIQMLSSLCLIKRKLSSVELVFLFFVLTGFTGFAQNTSERMFEQSIRPYNQELRLSIIDSDEPISGMDSTVALFVYCDRIKNPISFLQQLGSIRELHLLKARQAHIDQINNFTLPNLTHLFIEHFQEDSLYIEPINSVEHLAIFSDSLIFLDASDSLWEKVEILDVQARRLIKWRGKTDFPEVSLIHMATPSLTDVPYFSAKNVNELLWECSLDSFPKWFCSSSSMRFISVKFFRYIDVENCFIEKVQNGVYSDLTVYENGNLVPLLEVISKDRKAKN